MNINYQMDFINLMPGVALKNVNLGWLLLETLQSALLLLNGALANHVSSQHAKNLSLIGLLVSCTMIAKMKAVPKSIGKANKRRRRSARSCVHLDTKTCLQRVEHVVKMVIGKE